MSVNDLEKAFQLMNEHFDEEELDFCGKQSLSTIESAEKVLGYKFPHSYRVFLEKYGCGGIGGMEIYGLIEDEEFSVENIPFVAVPNMVWTTLQWHKDFGHPLYLLVIYEVGEGSTYCLDTSKMNAEGECPVVVWPIGGYEQTPILELIAEDFGAFFLDMVKREIEYKNSTE